MHGSSLRLRVSERWPASSCSRVAIGNAWLRSLLRCLAAVWLLLPWNIQVVEGEYAPAFIVALFEGVFRADGNPRPALMVLTLASLLVIIVFLIVGAVRRVRASRA